MDAGNRCNAAGNHLVSIRRKTTKVTFPPEPAREHYLGTAPTPHTSQFSFGDIGNFFEDVGKGIGDIVEDVGKDIGKHVGYFVGDVGEHMGYFVDDVGEHTGYFVGDVKEHMGYAVEDVKEHMGYAIEDVKEHMGYAIEDVKEHMGYAFEDVKEHMGYAFDDVKEHMGYAFVDTWEFFDDLREDIVDFINELLPAGMTIEDIGDFIFDELEKVIPVKKTIIKVLLFKVVIPYILTVTGVELELEIAKLIFDFIWEHHDDIVQVAEDIFDIAVTTGRSPREGMKLAIQKAHEYAEKIKEYIVYQAMTVYEDTMAIATHPREVVEITQDFLESGWGDLFGKKSAPNRTRGAKTNYENTSALGNRETPFRTKVSVQNHNQLNCRDTWGF